MLVVLKAADLESRADFGCYIEAETLRARALPVFRDRRRGLSK
jgi:hypothetical protein